MHNKQYINIISIWSFHLIIVASKNVIIIWSSRKFWKWNALPCCIVCQLESINVQQAGSSLLSDISGSPNSFHFGSKMQEMPKSFKDVLVIVHSSSLPANFHSKKAQKLLLFVCHWDVPQKMGMHLLPQRMHPYSSSCNLMTERGLLFLKSLITLSNVGKYGDNDLYSLFIASPLPL